MEETIGNIEINPTNKTQGNITDTNKGEVTQGNIEINQILTQDPSTKCSTKENIEISGTTNKKITPAPSAMPSLANWVLKKGEKHIPPSIDCLFDAVINNVETRVCF